MTDGNTSSISQTLIGTDGSSLTASLVEIASLPIKLCVFNKILDDKSIVWVIKANHTFSKKRRFRIKMEAQDLDVLLDQFKAELNSYLVGTNLRDEQLHGC